MYTFGSGRSSDSKPSQGPPSTSGQEDFGLRAPARPFSIMEEVVQQTRPPPQASQGTELLERPFGAGVTDPGFDTEVGFGGRPLCAAGPNSNAATGYGRGDLLPGGSLNPSGSSLVGRGNFAGYVQGLREGCGGGGEGEAPGQLPFGAQPRYDPMFTMDPNGFAGLPGGNFGGRGRGEVFPGEPDNDLLPPPGVLGFRGRGGFGRGGAFGGFGGGMY